MIEDKKSTNRDKKPDEIEFIKDDFNESESRYDENDRDIPCYDNWKKKCENPF